MIAHGRIGPDSGAAGSGRLLSAEAFVLAERALADLMREIDRRKATVLALSISIEEEGSRDRWFATAWA